MESKVIIPKQDLTHLKWAHARNSSGTAGTFLKSQTLLSGKKIYYKLSGFDSERGITGHECINEIIVDRLLEILGVEHLQYQLIHADIKIDNRIYETWLCASEDFKKRGETKAALDDYFQINRKAEESRYEFCCNNGWKNYINTMLAVDYLILNRDRHGANIEVLRNARKHTIRLAPLFDHGLSLLCSCYDDKDIETFDVMADKPCQNFVGSRSVYENLHFIEDKSAVFGGKLKEQDRTYIFQDLENAISPVHMDKIWDMIYSRWCIYEKLCNS